MLLLMWKKLEVVQILAQRTFWETHTTHSLSEKTAITKTSAEFFQKKTIPQQSATLNYKESTYTIIVNIKIYGNHMRSCKETSEALVPGKVLQLEHLAPWAAF